MGTITVKNLNGTADSPKCPCGSWINHWKNYAQDDKPFCSVPACPKEAEVGAHVQKADDEKSWYIIPLCKAHNNLKGQELDIFDGVKLVPVISRDKCN